MKKASAFLAALLAIFCLPAMADSLAFTASAYWSFGQNSFSLDVSGDGFFGVGTDFGYYLNFLDLDPRSGNCDANLYCTISNAGYIDYSESFGSFMGTPAYLFGSASFHTDPFSAGNILGQSSVQLNVPGLACASGIFYSTPFPGIPLGGFGACEEVNIAIQLANAGPSTLYDVTNSSFTLSVPEPSSLMLLGSGTMGLAGVIRRKLHV